MKEEKNNIAQDLLFAFIAAGVSGKVAELELKDFEARELVTLIRNHGVSATAFEGQQKYVEKYPDNRALGLLTSVLQRMAKTQTMSYNNRRNAAKTLAEVWKIVGVDTVVIDSFAFANLYENSENCVIEGMTCYPVDSRTGMGNMATACKLMKVQNKQLDKEGKQCNFKYYGLDVKCLGYLSGNERLEKILLQLLKEEGTTPFEDTKLECPSQMFTLLAMAYRIQQFLLAGKIRMIDICHWAVLLQAGKDLDWKRFWSYCEESGLKKYASAMTVLANTVCGVELPEGVARDEKAEELLLQYILEDGAAQEKNSAGVVSRVMGVVKNRERYDQFSDGSIFRNMLKAFSGK